MLNLNDDFRLFPAKNGGWIVLQNNRYVAAFDTYAALLHWLGKMEVPKGETTFR